MTSSGAGELPDAGRARYTSDIPPTAIRFCKM
jgi:hypothetical protein